MVNKLVQQLPGCWPPAQHNATGCVPVTTPAQPEVSLLFDAYKQLKKQLKKLPEKVGPGPFRGRGSECLWVWGMPRVPTCDTPAHATKV